MMPTPDWLVETIARESRMLHSTPKTIADAVWRDFAEKVELEIQDRVETLAENSLRMVTDYRLVDKTTLPGFRT